MAIIGHLTISRPYGPRNVARAQRGCLDPVQATFRGPMALVSPSESTSGGLNGWMDNSGHQPTLQPAHQLLRPRAFVPGPSNIPRARANCCSSGRSPLRARGGLLICSQSGPDFCDGPVFSHSLMGPQSSILWDSSEWTEMDSIDSEYPDVSPLLSTF